VYGVSWHVIWCVACSSMTWSILLSHLRVLSLSKKSSLIWALRMGKNLKTYSLLVYRVNFILYLCSWLLLTVGKSLGYLGNGWAEVFCIKKVRVQVEWALPLLLLLIIMLFWIWENMLSTGNEVHWTSPANHPPMWSKWSQRSMPPNVTRSKCIQSL